MVVADAFAHSFMHNEPNSHLHPDASSSFPDPTACSTHPDDVAPMVVVVVVAAAAAAEERWKYH